MDAEVADFLRYCKIERRLAEETCRAYARDVGACIVSLRSVGVESLEEVRIRHLRGFLDAEAGHRPAPSSQARTIAALRGFFRFCVENEYLDRDPAAALRTPKQPEVLPDVLERGELRRLLSAPGRGRRGERALFIGVQGKRLSATILASTFRRYASAAGVTERRRVTPHTRLKT
jgi:integrase/recombinase XerC